MTIAKPSSALRTVKLGSDSKSILEAARTVSLAFSNDSLIRWLRPGGAPWALLDDVSMNWQRRRLRRAMKEAIVMRLVLAGDGRLIEAAGDKYPLTTERTIPSSNDHTAEAAPIAILYPAHISLWKRAQQRFWKLYFDLLDKVDPVWDPATSWTRVEELMEQNHNCLEETRQQLKPVKPFYLEVMAVRPTMHGQGFGGKLMAAILQEVDGEPVMLECTEKSNIGFYEKYGFKVVKEVLLEDKTSAIASTLTYWLMLRPGKSV